MIPALETVHTYCTATPNQDTCNLRTRGLQNESILATIRPTCTCCDGTPKHRKTVLLEGVGVFLRNSEKSTMQSTSNVEIIDYIVVVVGGGGTTMTKNWLWEREILRGTFQKFTTSYWVIYIFKRRDSRCAYRASGFSKRPEKIKWSMLKPKAECDTIVHCKVPQFSRHGGEQDDSLLEDGFHWSPHEHYISYS